MKHTEFWNVMERVFPGGRARSVAQDLALLGLGSMTADEALAAGVAPQDVWREIVAVENLPQRYEYLHRIDPDKTSKAG